LRKIEVRVKILGEKAVRRVRIPPRTNVAALLRQLNINREAVAVRVDGKIIAEEEPLSPGSSVEIIPIVTGG
jgi:thiamine biosynthesis protein ThiS